MDLNFVEVLKNKPSRSVVDRRLSPTSLPELDFGVTYCSDYKSEQKYK